MKHMILNGITTALCAAVIIQGSAAATPEREFVQQAVIDAPVAEVWRMFTTDDAAQQWMAPKVRIDLRVGGELRSSYHPESTLNDEHTIINRILTYQPQRLLAIQNVQAPAGFQHPELFQRAWSVIRFDPVDDARTSVRIAGLNYGEGPEWDALRDHFDQGNAYLLRLLQNAVRSVEFDAPDSAEEAIVCEEMVKASPASIWRAWTTQEGIAEFLAPQANIDLRIDGPYELHFAPDAPDGQRGSETCRVLAFEPLRMLSFSWNAPPQYPDARPHHTWVVMEFDQIDDEHVRVRLTQMGFDDLITKHPEHAEQFEQTRAYFARVWPHVLKSMKSVLEADTE